MPGVKVERMINATVDEVLEIARERQTYWILNGNRLPVSNDEAVARIAGWKSHFCTANKPKNYIRLTKSHSEFSVLIEAQLWRGERLLSCFPISEETWSLYREWPYANVNGIEALVYRKTV